jgi:hypothetical protein
MTAVEWEFEYWGGYVLRVSDNLMLAAYDDQDGLHWWHLTAHEYPHVVHLAEDNIGYKTLEEAQNAALIGLYEYANKLVNFVKG